MSPWAPQPKQWKKPFTSFTVKEGVFSEWNGHNPEYSCPFLVNLTCREIKSDNPIRDLISSRNDGGKFMLPLFTPHPSSFKQYRAVLNRIHPISTDLRMALALPKSIRPEYRSRSNPIEVPMSFKLLASISLITAVTAASIS